MGDVKAYPSYSIAAHGLGVSAYWVMEHGL